MYVVSPKQTIFALSTRQKISLSDKRGINPRVHFFIIYIEKTLIFYGFHAYTSPYNCLLATPF